MSRFLIVAMLIGWFSSKVTAEQLPDPVRSSIPRKVFVNGPEWLKLEWASDHLLHFEFGHGKQPGLDTPIAVSQIYKNSVFAGAKSFRVIAPDRFETQEMEVTVTGLCFTVKDRLRGNLAGSYCADDMNQSWKVLQADTVDVKNIYGLGQIFDEPGSMSADRIGKVIKTSGDFGNMMQSYAGGAVGETLFPVAYALTGNSRSWVLALDNIYKQTWDLTTKTWKIGMFGDRVSGFVMVGSSPLELRKRFMNLSGRAPVPPRKLFGFWMSEYGYDDWNEVDERLVSMRTDQFPIDGFFLDLQWFGNISPGSDYTAMGKLTFDESKFPDPVGRIASYKKMGIGLIPIEESYVGKALPEYKDLGDRGFMAHECGRPTTPSYLTGEVTGNTSEWWGRGGMIDWSNPRAGAYWHDLKRQPLVDMGLFAHWLDLGEPEMFDKNSCYFGSGEPGKIKHQDIHNLFSLQWAESVFNGYLKNSVKQRPFSMLRSGNVGIQQYGAGLWSGDIGGNLESLAAHIGSNSHMSWSGIDYYSSDIGGFHRNRASGRPLSASETQENFTKWFANSAWFDVPFRTHVINLDNDRKTAPNRIGHIESNKANLLHRYRLTPYYYSLAWQAWLEGTPLLTPMAMAFPENKPLRSVGDQRMLGDIMIAAAAVSGMYERTVLFPEGLWYDLRNGMSNVSDGSERSSHTGVPMYLNGLFQLPAYAKGGAIIPRLSDSSLNKLIEKGARSSSDEEMAVDVYVGPNDDETVFTLYEDDGETVDYLSGAVRKTRIRQMTAGLKTTIHFDAAEGSYRGATALRSWLINVHAPAGLALSQVIYAGHVVSPCSVDSDEDAVCYRAGTTPGSLAEIHLGAVSVSTPRKVEVTWSAISERSASAHFVCADNDPAQRYFGMYVVGEDPKLGAWDVLKGVSLTTSPFLRGMWTGTISGLPVGKTIEWKCVKIHPQTSERGIEWQPGTNNQLKTTGDGGFSGMTRGSFVRNWDLIEE